MAVYRLEFKEELIWKSLPSHHQRMADLSHEQSTVKHSNWECELRPKEKALAETAALLTLSKKARAIWRVWTCLTTLRSPLPTSQKHVYRRKTERS